MTSAVEHLLRPDPMRATLSLRGLEADNLLAFLALLGALRALDRARPGWAARASWMGPPWEARLHLAEEVAEEDVGVAASEGCEIVATCFDDDGRRNVSFTRDEYRAFASRLRADPVGAALVAALAAEWPEKKAGGVQAGPLVMLFGQGHQDFLDRLLAVPRGDLPPRHKKARKPPDLRDPAKVTEALFRPWRRSDDADAFRWDPEEDQRYALRFDNPSTAGAAATVHGANRLAALGFLTYACAPSASGPAVPGVTRDREGVSFVWPLWTAPLTLSAIEALLSHPEVIRGDLERVRPLGIVEILRARRIPNGKFMNVTRAMPLRPSRRSV
jgi:hypothetical protein